MPNAAVVVEEWDIVGSGPEIVMPYCVGGAAFPGNGGTGGGSLESDERDCCDIEGRFTVEPDSDLVRSNMESCDSCGDVASPDMDDDVTKVGAVVAVDPRRGFDRVKSLGIRTDVRRFDTLDPDECIFPWWCSWF